jgi:uncharacterized membrane protein
MYWRELVLFYFLICGVALAVGLFFALQGLWLVLPFFGLEMLALGIAFYMLARRGCKREVIIFEGSKMRIEKGVYHCDQSWEFNAAWVRLHCRIADEINSRRKLELGVHHSYVEVGEFLSNIEKDELAFQLKNCIILC